MTQALDRDAEFVSARPNRVWAGPDPSAQATVCDTADSAVLKADDWFLDALSSHLQSLSIEVLNIKDVKSPDLRQDFIKSICNRIIEENNIECAVGVLEKDVFDAGSQKLEIANSLEEKLSCTDDDLRDKETFSPSDCAGSQKSCLQNFKNQGALQDFADLSIHNSHNFFSPNIYIFNEVRFERSFLKNEYFTLLGSDLKNIPYVDFFKKLGMKSYCQDDRKRNFEFPNLPSHFPMMRVGQTAYTSREVGQYLDFKLVNFEVKDFESLEKNMDQLNCRKGDDRTYPSAEAENREPCIMENIAEITSKICDIHEHQKKRDQEFESKLESIASFLQERFRGFEFIEKSDVNSDSQIDKAILDEIGFLREHLHSFMFNAKNSLDADAIRNAMSRQSVAITTALGNYQHMSAKILEEVKAARRELGEHREFRGDFDHSVQLIESRIFDTLDRKLQNHAAKDDLGASADIIRDAVVSAIKSTMAEIIERASVLNEEAVNRGYISEFGGKISELSESFSDISKNVVCIREATESLLARPSPSVDTSQVRASISRLSVSLSQNLQQQQQTLTALEVMLAGHVKQARNGSFSRHKLEGEETLTCENIVIQGDSDLSDAQISADPKVISKKNNSNRGDPPSDQSEVSPCLSEKDSTNGENCAQDSVARNAAIDEDLSLDSKSLNASEAVTSQGVEALLESDIQPDIKKLISNTLQAIVAETIALQQMRLSNEN